MVGEATWRVDSTVRVAHGYNAFGVSARGLGRRSAFDIIDPEGSGAV